MELTASNTADATKVRKETEEMSKVGEIVVKVYRSNDVGLRSGTLKPIKGSFNNFDSDISEMALKGEAKYHGVS